MRRDDLTKRQQARKRQRNKSLPLRLTPYVSQFEHRNLTYDPKPSAKQSSVARQEPPARPLFLIGADPRLAE